MPDTPRPEDAAQRIGVAQRELQRLLRYWEEGPGFPRLGPSGSVPEVK